MLEIEKGSNQSYPPHWFNKFVLISTIFINKVSCTLDIFKTWIQIKCIIMWHTR